MDTGDSAWGIFADEELLLTCPRCGACARSGATAERFVTRRLTCGACGLAAELGSTVFPDPLWLKVPCCGEVLWAFNARHLDLIERFVAADLRERARDEHGWRNGSLASRLPRWVQKGSNRAAVLRAVAALRERLPA